MKIAHYSEGRCNPDSANGVDKTIFGLCRSQAAMGQKVGLFCTSNKQEIPIEGIHVKNFPKPHFPFSVSSSLLKSLADFNPDIIHFHSGFIPRNTTLARWARKNSICYAVTPNGNCSTKLLRRRPALKVPYWNLFEKPYLNRAAFLHAVGDRQEIERFDLRVPIVDALNGIDPDIIPYPKNSGLILQSLPHWAGRKIFLFVGRLDVQQKGLDLLVSGFSDAVDRGLKGSLLFVGPDWQGGKTVLEKLRRDLRLENHFYLWGGAYGSEKFDILSGADYFVHPSRWEGMSFSVIEALACGKICLVTPEADPGGLIRKYSAGHLVGPTADSISTGLRELAKITEADRKAILQNASDLVRKELGWNGITNSILNAYREFGNLK